MTLETVLVLAALLVGIGAWGVVSQQSFVMVMMGLELMINGVILAAAGVWRFSAGGDPKGQVLVIGFAMVIAVHRARQVETTEGLDRMAG